MLHQCQYSLSVNLNLMHLRAILSPTPPLSTPISLSLWGWGEGEGGECGGGWGSQKKGPGCSCGALKLSPLPQALSSWHLTKCKHTHTHTHTHTHKHTHRQTHTVVWSPDDKAAMVQTPVNKVICWHDSRRRHLDSMKHCSQNHQII